MSTLETFISSEIAPLATALQTNIKTAKNIDVDYNVLVNWLSDYVDATKETYLELSKINPSFESIKSQLITRLKQKNSWSVILQSGIGETLLEFISAIGDYSQTSIQRAYQETSLDAVLTSSIYTITRFLGVSIDRKVPAQVNASLYQTDTVLTGVSIPSMSQLSINGLAFFNRDPITFNNNTINNPVSVVLYQGLVKVEQFLSTGTPFQTVEIGFNDYRVADQDVRCLINNNTKYMVITNGLWHYSSDDTVVASATTGNGNVEMTFGNGVFGKVPEVNTTISFVYALTDGSTSNTTNNNIAVELVDTNDYVPDRLRASNSNDLLAQKNALKTLEGITTSAIFNGADEKTQDFYAVLAPGIRAANKRIVTRPDHRALGMNFPNVADVLFQGQRELNPNKKAWTNVIGVTVLKKDGSVMTSDEYYSYIEYLNSLEIWRCDFYRIDPQPVYFDFYGDCYCTQKTDLTNIKSFIKSNIIEFFRPKLGIIGRSVYENDAETLYKYKYGTMEVDYVQNVTPHVDTELNKYGFTPQFPVLRSFDIKTYYSLRYYNSVTPTILGSI